MRVLVTGSSGRVGRAVCLALSRVHQVVGFDCSPASNTEIVADLLDQTALNRAMAGVDAVVHIAGLHAPQVGLRSDADFQRVNVDGCRRLLEAIAAAGVHRLVYTSTTAVYGHAASLPDRAAWLDEDSEPQPRTIYHRSKLAAEAVLREAAAQGGPATVILRMSRCFPEAAERMAVYRLHRGVDARDVASAHRLAVEGASQGSRIYLISGATPFVPEDCTELRSQPAQVLGRRMPSLVAEFDRRQWLLPGTIDRVYFSGRASAELGWRPQHGFEAVLEDYDQGVAEVLLPSNWPLPHR